MIRRLFISLALSLGVTATMAQTAPVAPDQLVKQMSTDVLEAAKADKAVQAGDLNRVVALVDAKVLPFLDFQRMTSTAVGRFWRQATPEQQKRLQDEFKLLLTRSYAGALSQVKNVNIIMKPLRADAADTEVVVKTEIRGKGDPIMLDYRLAKQADGNWRIYDVNVLGVWMVDNYRNSFTQEINKNGLDGLIKLLSDKNKAMKS